MQTCLRLPSLLAAEHKTNNNSAKQKAYQSSPPLSLSLSLSLSLHRLQHHPTNLQQHTKRREGQGAQASVTFGLHRLLLLLLGLQRGHLPPALQVDLLNEPF